MKSKNLLSFIFALLSCGACTSSALAQAPGAPASSANVSMKLDLVAWGPDIPGLTIRAGNKNNAVTAKAFTYSKSVSYSGPNVIEIYQTEGLPAEAPLRDENGKELSRRQKKALTEMAPPEVEKQRKDKPGLVALAVLPTNSKRATVLLAPTKNGLFRAWVIDDDPEKLPTGKLRIHNYAPMRIAMNFNNGKISKEFKPNESFIVSPENNRVIYELAYQQEGEWKMQENNLLSVPAAEQAQLIILRSEEDFFLSGTGSRSGYLQTVVLRRGKDEPEEKPAP